MGVKNSQSPQRPQEGPVKPSIGSVKSVVKNLEETVSSNSKGKSKLQSNATSPQKALRHSPVQPQILHDLDEGTSYHTVSTPFQEAPRTPPAGKPDTMTLNNRPAFETPAGNIGEAGAIRMRKGEMLDAMNAGPEQAQEVQSEEVAELREEEMYPEIEYMPPSVGESL